jgi:hypothetical protein
LSTYYPSTESFGRKVYDQLGRSSYAAVGRLVISRQRRRVLKDEGRLLITMINPVVGFVVHAIRQRHDLDQLERGIGEEEAKGLWGKEVKELLARSRLRLAETIPFVFGLNRLYIAEKDRTGDHQS